MTEELKTQLSQFLQYLAESIDIPDNLYERAERRYQSIGDWLTEKRPALLTMNRTSMLRAHFASAPWSN